MTDHKKTLVYILIASFVIWVLICGTSCNVTKHDAKKLSKIAERSPEVVAAKCVEKFPCVTMASDTIRDSVDNIIFVQCPDDYVKDTVQVVNEKIVYKPVLIGKNNVVAVRVPQETITIVKSVKDSAELFLLHAELNKAKLALNKANEVIVSQGKEIAHKSKENWLWRILAMLLIGWQVFKIYRKLKKPILP